ncbi:MAG: hypothetical protein FRX48_03326 [Lasallia pustulata]|uniref:Uncharacterized protein n=1 Tax=Lasallia pustulata TaxID=136370 RepID=A0A5M8PVD0_9LECA|nr:MAG: hypothetical protein FRX48_03326 [Lasallia pustulata]
MRVKILVQGQSGRALRSRAIGIAFCLFQCAIGSLNPLIPLTSNSQCMLFWYIAETLPPEMEKELNAKTGTEATATSPTPYQYLPKYPATLTLGERLEMEVGGYEPVHHLNTAVDSEEALYESHLLPVKEAVQKLKGTIQEDVVRSGWQAIVRRHQTESKA